MRKIIINGCVLLVTLIIQLFFLCSPSDSAMRDFKNTYMALATTTLTLEKDFRENPGDYTDSWIESVKSIGAYLEDKGAAMEKMNSDIESNMKKIYAMKRRVEKLANLNIPPKALEQIKKGQQSLFQYENGLVSLSKRLSAEADEEAKHLSKIWPRLGKLGKRVSTGADILTLVRDIGDISVKDKNFTDAVIANSESTSNILQTVLSIFKLDSIQGAGGALLLWNVSLELFDVSGDKLRELAEYNLTNLNDFRNQYNDDVRNALSTILMNSKGKNIVQIENEAKAAIAKIATVAYERVRPPNGDIYQSVLGSPIMGGSDLFSGGALFSTFTDVSTYISGFTFSESADIAMFLKKTHYRDKIIAMQSYHNTMDEMNLLQKETEAMQTAYTYKMSKIIYIPNIPPEQGSNLKITTLTASSHDIAAGSGNIFFSATTSSEAGGVSLTIHNNGVKEQVIDLPSANKKDWHSALETLATPGIRKIIASVKDKSGKLVTGGDFGPITVTVKPLAYVSAVSATPDTVSLGGNVTFTATVKNVVAANAEVMLKLDNDEVKMERPGNTYKKTLQITKTLPDNTRTYTAYVRENGVSSAAPAAKTIKFTIGGAIKTVTAFIAGKPTTTFTRGEPIDFVVRLSTPTIGQIILMLDTFPVPMSKQSDGSWKGSTKIYDVPADGKRNFWAYVREGSQNGPQTQHQTLKLIGPGPSKLTCTPQNVNKGDTLTISVVKGNSAYEVKGYFLDKNGEKVAIPFTEKTLEEWVYSPRISESGKGIKKFNVTVEDKGKIVETFSCDVAFNGAALPAPPDTDGMEQGFSLTDADISITKKRINHVSWEIKVNVHKLPQAPKALYATIQFPEGGLQLPGLPNKPPIELSLGYPGRDNNMNFIVNRSTERAVPFNIVVYFMGANKPFFRSSRDFIPAEVNSGALVKTLYESFANAYSSMNESGVMSLISDQWEAGDGTTLSDLSGTLRNTFKIFNTVKCTISNLNVTPKGAPGKFIARYEITITARNYKYNIPHEEKSSVEEEVTIENGRPKITKTMSGRFWYVQ